MRGSQGCPNRADPFTAAPAPALSNDPRHALRIRCEPSVAAQMGFFYLRRFQGLASIKAATYAAPRHLTTQARWCGASLV